MEGKQPKSNTKQTITDQVGRDGLHYCNLNTELSMKTNTNNHWDYAPSPFHGRLK